MKAEIISIGTEILLGSIVNTNSQYISKRLAELGIDMYFQTTVGDNKNRIIEALEIASNRADLIITTGGLGPTEDDITRNVVAEYFDKTLKFNADIMKNIEDYFLQRGLQTTPNNKVQAYLPENSVMLENNHGTAPGFILNEKNKIVIVLPGPPKEMIPMFKLAEEYLKSMATLPQIYSRTINICGLPESEVAEKIADVISSQTNPTIAIYAKNFIVTVRITTKANSKEEAQKIMNPTANMLYDKLGKNIFGEDDDTLATAVLKLLNDNQFKIACAESCTGGLLTSTLVDCAGISSVLSEGIVTYSNDSKINRLDVQKDTLAKFGAVSQETAYEMAKNIALKNNADIGIATTGVAGPECSEKKPVGLVFIGLYIKGNVFVKKCNFIGDRNSIRFQTVITALDFLRRNMIKL